MRNVKFIFLYLIVDLLFGLMLYLGYSYAVKYGMMFVPVPFLSIKILFGVVGLTLSSILFKWLRDFLICIVKSAYIYSLSQETNYGVLKSLKGVIKLFKYTAIIPIFNKLIRKCVVELITNLKESSEGILEVGGISNFINRIVKNDITGIGKWLVVKELSYVDEFVLYHCYKNSKNKLYDSAIKSFKLFIKNSAKMFGVIATTTTINAIIKLFYWIVAIYLPIGIVKVDMTLDFIVYYYVFVKSVSFVIDDCILNPLLMKNVLSIFDVMEEDDELDIKEMIPSLADLKKLLM